MNTCETRSKRQCAPTAGTSSPPATTAALLTPLFQYAGNLTWREAAAAAIAPVCMMLALKLVIDGWLGPAELDTDDAELVDVHVDRRGRLHGSWRRRPHQ